MNITNIINILSKKTNFDEKKSLDIYNFFWDYIKKELENNGKVEIKGLGKFYIEPIDEKENKIKFDADQQFLDNFITRNIGEDKNE